MCKVEPLLSPAVSALHFGALGKRLGKRMGEMKKAVLDLTSEQMIAFRKTQSLTLLGDFELTGDDDMTFISSTLLAGRCR